MEENINVNPNDDIDNGNGRIALYIVFTFVITYVYEYFFIMKYLMNNPNESIASISLRLAIVMIMPSIGVIFTRVFTGEGFSDLYIKFDLKNKKFLYYIVAWFLPSVLTILGAVLYFGIFRSEFSWDMEYFMDICRKRGETGYSADDLRNIIISQTVTAIFLGPVLNCITCFGEEWGWRGYLLPKLLKKFRIGNALIIEGIVWGLWYAPIIVMGYNYGLGYVAYPYLGIFAMCIFCFVIGTIFSFFTIRTGSCIPSVIAHGAFNSICSMAIYFTKTGGNSLLGPSPVGLIGGAFFIICAIVCYLILNKSNEMEK